MSPKRFLRGLINGPVKPLEIVKKPAKLDDSYPDHINTWASKLKNSVDGLRDDSTDLQKKYENAPLRRKTKKKGPKPKK